MLFRSLVAFIVIVVLASVGTALVFVPVGSLLGIPAVINLDSDADVHINMMGQQLQPDADGNILIPVLPALVIGLLGLFILTGTLWTARGLGVVYGHVVQAIQVARPQPLRAVSAAPVDPPVIAPR